jgi:hypothetical protein
MYVTLGTPGPVGTAGCGTGVVCVCPIPGPLAATNAFLPPTFPLVVPVVYDATVPEWRGSFTACDGTTATIHVFLDLDTAPPCYVTVQILNATQPAITNVSWHEPIESITPTGANCQSPAPPWCTLAGWVLCWSAGNACDYFVQLGNDAAGCAPGGGGGVGLPSGFSTGFSLGFR